MQAAAEGGALDRVSFLGQLRHWQVIALQQRCDIYVSLNPMGNLTNANLEAIKAGACTIIPASRPVEGVDVDTDELVPQDAVTRIAPYDDIEGLTAAVLRLYRDPGERAKRPEAAAVGGLSIPGWGERIDREISMLEDIAARGHGAGRAKDPEVAATTGR